MKANLLALLLVALVVPAGGCRKAPRPQPNAPVGRKVQPSQDHLQRALDTLSRYDEFDPQKGLLQAAYHLNRWAEGIGDEDGWQPDATLRRLPEPFRSSAQVVDLDKRQYTLEDMRFVREAYWMRDLGNWIARQPTPAGFEQWLADVKKAQGEQQAYELGLALRLFDWTIRNVQLVKLPPYPTIPAGPASKPGEQPPRSPPEQAIAGPGYTAFPWQTLLFGMGDSWQRARVFTLLARQHQLDVVMLAFEDPLATPRLRPWLPAALLDDQLYLFDTELGLPIPGPDGAGIATLRQVRKDAELLRSLDVGQEHPYAAARAKLDSLVALIDAAPLALSRRMKLIEANLPSRTPLVLTLDAARLADRVGKCEGVGRAELWIVPWETCLYQAALDARMETDPALLGLKLQRDWVFNGMHPLMQGRQRHFRGLFENEDQKDGGKALYLRTRLPDSVINQMETSPETQAELGIVRGRENEQEWKIRLQLQKGIAVQVKHNATYWLGLIHEDTGNYDAAVSWLKRTLDTKENNAWKAGARYNLARVYEAQGELEQARKLLLLDDSPQRHGNLLRARLLRKRLEAKP
jgi:tetratricopeptide (TPR) repeat protein